MFSVCLWFSLIGVCFTYALAISVNRPARCSLDVEEGHCQEQFLRWFFNSKSGHCQTFVYSGCGGNANNFNATMYCLLACNGTEADTHKYSITSNQTDQLKSGTEKNQEDNQSKKKSDASKQVIRSKRSNDPQKSSTNPRKPNHKGRKDESKDANDVQEILSQLSRSVNLLEKIVKDKEGKAPKKRSGKKQRRQKSPSPTASADTLPSKQSNAPEEEEGKQRSLKTIDVNNHSEQSKTNDLEDDETGYNVEERNMLDAKIKGIISDPSYVFSYNNISARDMSVLKEVVFGMDAKALRFVAPSTGDNGGKVDAGNEPDETTILQVTEADEKNQVIEEPPVKGL